MAPFARESLLLISFVSRLVVSSYFKRSHSREGADALYNLFPYTRMRLGVTAESAIELFNKLSSAF